MLSDATESNAQRNKLSLQAIKSSGRSHFRKTHLKWCEVVMRLTVSLNTLGKISRQGKDREILGKPRVYVKVSPGFDNERHK